MSFASEITVQPGHGYVVLVLVFSALAVHFYGGFMVGGARKKYKVDYPKLYADGDSAEAKAFNCVQRGHQNVLENVATHYMLTIVASLYRPEIGAIAALVRALGFVAYMQGYASGNPASRSRGFFGYFGFFAQLGLMFELAYRLLAQ